MCTNDSNQNVVPDLTQSAGHLMKMDAAKPFEFHPSTLAAKISACVAASYDGQKICVNFPVVGDICFNVSLPLPAGVQVKVCMETCGFRFGIPPFNGIRATVYGNNQPLWSGVIWGSC